MSDHPRLGYCCKFIPPDGDPVATRRMNLVNTTMTALGRLERVAAFDKVMGLVAHNLDALRCQVEDVASRRPLERLLRVVSNVLPAYTHPVAAWMYRESAMRDVVEPGLARIGALARAGDVRMSMHPGQFCVLATTNDGARDNAIEELDYHAEVMAMMGYGGGWHPFGAHINIHGGARAAGIEGFRYGLSRVSEMARNLVTAENDEVSYGLDDLLPLGDAVPIVLDLHHHWIASRGEYIEPDDPRIARIKASWREVRPVGHISVSREDLLVGHAPDARPDFAALIDAGLKARDLRAHSDLMWNARVNDLVARHLAWTDFEVEAKFKNLASEGLARHVEAWRQGGETASAA